MGMVFCRGCGKEIHETALMCPMCGAPQGSAKGVGEPRSVVKLIGLGLFWGLVLWLISLFLVGMIVGVLNPHDAYEAGGRVGESLGGLFLIVSMILSTILTVQGKLPGTRKV